MANTDLKLSELEVAIFALVMTHYKADHVSMLLV